MLFRHSAVTNIQRDHIVESWHRMPRDIMPLYIGSGELAIGIDATGMQGLDFQHGQYRDTMTFENPTSLTMKHLHIFRDEALSQHYAQPELVVTSEIDVTYSSLPNGWLDYELTIDGKTYTAEDLLAQASDWSRTFWPERGLAITQFTIANVRITWDMVMGKDAVEADYAFSADSLDGESHAVEVKAICHLTLRGGEPIPTGGLTNGVADDYAYQRWHAETETSSAKVLHPVDISYGWLCTDSATYTCNDQEVSMTWKGQGESLSMGLRFVCGSDRDGTESLDHLKQRKQSLKDQGIQACINEAIKTWQQYFEGTADIWLGDVNKEFLLKQTQYVLRAGGQWENGVPLGTLWTQKFNARTFWDTYFAADGLLRCGHIQELRDICAWFVKTMQPSGRPHCWMTPYDGSIPTNPEKDIAYQVCLAFAGIAIRLYETTMDDTDLRERVYPYLYRVTEYAVQELFEQQGSDWILAGTTAHDVGDEILIADEQKDMIAWLAACIGKCVDYADKLGESDDVLTSARSISDYYQAKKIAITQGTWVMWLPYLALPIPFEDRKAWLDHILGIAEEDDGKNKQVEPESPLSGWSPRDFSRLNNSGYSAMCWHNFTFASSLLIEGESDYALHQQEMGLNEVTGPGYFNETGFEWQVDGNSPYVPAGGAYLSSLMLMFADNNLWDDEVRVAVNFPSQWRSERIAWKNIHTFNGCRISGAYEPMRMEVEIAADRACKVRMRVPLRIVGEPITVTRNGQLIDVDVDLVAETFVVDLEPGVWKFVVERDLTTSHEVVLWEPALQGREFSEVLRDGGLDVRWNRDYDAMPNLLDKGKVVVFHSNNLMTSPKYAQPMVNAVKEGKHMVTMFHAASRAIEPEYAKMLGVNTSFDIDEFWWKEPVKESTWTLTDVGQELLPDMPESFVMPIVLSMETNPEPDVEVLATDERGQAMVTRRKVGQGSAMWMAAGHKRMRGRYPAYAMMILQGHRQEDFGDLQWLKSDAWQKLIVALTRLGLSAS